MPVTREDRAGAPAVAGPPAAAAGRPGCAAPRPRRAGAADDGTARCSIWPPSRRVGASCSSNWASASSCLDVDVPEVRSAHEPPLTTSAVWRARSGRRTAGCGGRRGRGARRRYGGRAGRRGKIPVSPPMPPRWPPCWRLSGRRVHLSCRWCGWWARARGARRERVGRYLRHLDEAIAACTASGEPHGRAGACRHPGARRRLQANLAGSYSGVMGLPLFETAGLLRRFGLLARRADSQTSAQSLIDKAPPAAISSNARSASPAPRMRLAQHGFSRACQAVAQ